jgi:outer membrane protein assembly factor BamB
MQLRTPTSGIRLPLLACLIALLVTAVVPAIARADWTAYQGDSGHTGFAPGGELGRGPLGVAWTRTLGTNLSYPLIADGKAFVSYTTSGTNGSTVAALDLATGNTVWWRQQASSAQLAYDGGRVFISESSGVVTAVDAASGATQWARQLSSYYSTSAPTATGGSVYVNNYSSLYSLDEDDGSTNWSAGASDSSQPSVTGNVVVLGCTSAYDRATGRRLWTYYAGSCSSSVAAPTDGGRVLSRGGGVLDTAAGSLRDTWAGSTAALAGATAVDSNGSALQAHNFVTGVGQWEFRPGTSVTSPPLVADGIAYAGAYDGKIYGRDLETGDAVWQATLGGSYTSVGAPGRAAGEGKLLVPVNGTLTAFATQQLTTPAGADVRVTSGPQGYTTSDTATFAFASTGSGPVTQCRIDNGDWTPCTATATYTGLADGPHLFEVETVDGLSGDRIGVAARGWAIDTKAPQSTITGGPSGITRSSYATFYFSANDANATLQCRLDGASWSACSSSVSYSALPEGNHTFEVRATDGVGNVESPPASRAWTVDTRAPDASITSGPQGTTASRSATFNFRSSDPDVTFECELDYAGYRTCSSPATFDGLADGTHSFHVRSKDQAGNYGYSSNWSWTVDATPPETTITDGPQGTTRTGNVSFSFTSSENGSRFECKLDSGTWDVCTSPRSYSALPDGTHTFQVRATDSVGGTDPSPASRTWTIDTTAPETTINTSTSGAQGSGAARFEFSANEPGATFQCQLDAGSWEVCTSPTSYVGLTPGSHTFRVQATDPVGNRDLSAASMGFTLTARAIAPDTAGTASSPAPLTLKGDDPPATTAATPPSSSTPKALVTQLKSGIANLRRKGKLAFKYAAPSAGLLQVEVRDRAKHLLATGTVSFSRATTGKGVVKATRAGRRALKAGKPLTLKVVFKPRGGEVTTATKKLPKA